MVDIKYIFFDLVSMSTGILVKNPIIYKEIDEKEMEFL